jgi:hypothetical protein
MISGRSGLIAVLVAYLDNQFYPIVLERLSHALQAKDFQILLFMTDQGNQDSVVQKCCSIRCKALSWRPQLCRQILPANVPRLESRLCYSTVTFLPRQLEA